MNGGSPARGRAASAATGAGDSDERGRGPGPEAEAGAAGAGGPAPEAMMGKEEEIARIARRLDKMVTKKSAVRGAGRQDPGTPAPPTPAEPAEPPSGSGRPPEGQDETPSQQRLPGRGETPVGGRDPCPGPALPFTPHPRQRPQSGLDPVPGAALSGLRPQLPGRDPADLRSVSFLAPNSRLPPAPTLPEPGQRKHPSVPPSRPCRSPSLFRAFVLAAPPPVSFSLSAWPSSRFTPTPSPSPRTLLRASSPTQSSLSHPRPPTSFLSLQEFGVRLDPLFLPRATALPLPLFGLGLMALIIPLHKQARGLSWWRGPLFSLYLPLPCKNRFP